MSLMSFLSSHGSMNGQQYMHNKPELDLREFFTGQVQAWGIIQNRRGHVIQQFDIDMVGSWDGDEGEVFENFIYYDGKTQQRIWRIKDMGNARYEGRADDIIGKADGRGFGNAGQWTYTLDVPVGDRHIRLTLDDWMWAMNNDVLINRSYMKKFGITFAELTIFLKKP